MVFDIIASDEKETWGRSAVDGNAWSVWDVEKGI